MTEEKRLSLGDNWSLSSGADHHHVLSPHWPLECDYKVVLVHACCTPEIPQCTSINHAKN